MKTKEEVLIKLGEQTKKVNIEFALLDDVKKLASKFEPLMAKSLSLYNQTILSFKEVEKILNDSDKLIDEGILKSKEIGIDDKMFSGFKNEVMGQKAKINNFLKRLNA